MIHFNLLMKVFLALFICRSLAQVYLNELNLSRLRQRPAIPEEFKGAVDQGKYETHLNYTLDSDRFGLWMTLLGEGIFLGPESPWTDLLCARIKEFLTDYPADWMLFELTS